VLSQPKSPAQTCTPVSKAYTVADGDATIPLIICATDSVLPPPDPYVYAANYGSAGANVSVFTSASGVLSAGTAVSAGSNPFSIAVAGGQYAYVTNYNSNSVSAYKITSGVLTALTDVDAGTVGDQTSIPTGTRPSGIAIHSSGKFAYVVNFSSNSISAYSIDPASGALARIDADGATAGNQTSIPTRSSPISIAIAITPSGGYAYVANSGSNNISAYSIDPTTGALIAIPANHSGGTLTYIDAGATPYSVAVDPTGTYLYVANSGSTGTAGISAYQIYADGTLATNGIWTTGSGPHSIAVNPNINNAYAYVVNTTDGTVETYIIESTGALTANDTEPTGSSPISISLDSTGQYAYVANSGSNDISVYDTFSTAGKLTQVNCTVSPAVCNGNNFKAGTSPYSVVTSR
jgi:6-phosphogluconolactonase